MRYEGLLQYGFILAWVIAIKPMVCFDADEDDIIEQAMSEDNKLASGVLQPTEDMMDMDLIKRADTNYGMPGDGGPMQPQQPPMPPQQQQPLQPQPGGRKPPGRENIVSDMKKYGLWEYTTDTTGMGDQIKELMKNSHDTGDAGDISSETLLKHADKVNEEIDKFAENPPTVPAPTIDPYDTPLGFGGQPTPPSATKPGNQDNVISISDNALSIEDEHGNNLDNFQQQSNNNNNQDKSSDMKPTTPPPTAAPGKRVGSTIMPTTALTLKLLNALKSSKPFLMHAQKLLDSPGDSDEDQFQKQKKLLDYLKEYETEKEKGEGKLNVDMTPSHSNENSAGSGGVAGIGGSAGVSRGSEGLSSKDEKPTGGSDQQNILVRVIQYLSTRDPSTKVSDILSLLKKAVAGVGSKTNSPKPASDDVNAIKSPPGTPDKPDKPLKIASGLAPKNEDIPVKVGPGMAAKSDEATGKVHDVPIKSGNDILKYYGGEIAKAVEKPIPTKTDNSAIVNIAAPPEGTSKTVDSNHNKGDEKIDKSKDKEQDKDKEDKEKEKGKEDKEKDKGKDNKEKEKDKEDKGKDKDKEKEKENQKEKEKEKSSSTTTSTDAGNDKMNKMLENLFNLYKAKTAAASGGVQADKTKGEKPKDALPEPPLKSQDPNFWTHPTSNITLNDPDLKDKMNKEEASILSLIRTNYNIDERTHAQLAKGFIKSKDFPPPDTPLTAHMASAEVGNPTPIFHEIRKDDLGTKTSDPSLMYKNDKLTDELRTMSYDANAKSSGVSMVKRNDGNGNQQSDESLTANQASPKISIAPQIATSEAAQKIAEMLIASKGGANTSLKDTAATAVKNDDSLKPSDTAQMPSMEVTPISGSVSEIVKADISSKTSTAMQASTGDKSVKLSDTVKPESKDVESSGMSHATNNDASAESITNTSKGGKSDISQKPTDASQLTANVSKIVNKTLEGVRDVSLRINKQKAEKIINENIEKAIANDEELGPHLSFNKLTLNTKKNEEENGEEAEDKKEEKEGPAYDTLSSSLRNDEASSSDTTDNQTMALKFNKEKVEQLLNQHLIRQATKKKNRKRYKRRHHKRHHKKDSDSSEDDKEDDEDEDDKEDGDEEGDEDEEGDHEEDDYVEASEKLKNKLKEEQPAPEYAYTKARKALKELVRLKMKELKTRKKKPENTEDSKVQDKVENSSYTKNSSDSNANNKDDDVNKKLEMIQKEKERLLKEEEQLKEKQKAMVKPSLTLNDSSPLVSATNGSRNQSEEAEATNKTIQEQSQSSSQMSLQKTTYHLHGLEPEVQSYKQQEQQQQEQQKQKFQQSVKEKATSVGHKEQDEVSNGIKQKPAEDGKDKQESKPSETKPSESNTLLNKNNTLAPSTGNKTSEDNISSNSKNTTGKDNKIQDNNADGLKGTSAATQQGKVDHMLALATPTSNAQQKPKTSNTDKQTQLPEQQNHTGGVDHKLNLAKGGSNGGSDDSSVDAQYGVRHGSHLHRFQNLTGTTTSSIIANNKHIMQNSARAESSTGTAVGLKHRYVKMGDTTYSPYEYYSFRTDARKNDNPSDNKNSNVAKKDSDLMELNVHGRGKVD